MSFSPRYRSRRRTNTVLFSTTVKNGLPCEVKARVHPPEPDVGIFQPQVELVNIYWPQKANLPKGIIPPLRPVPDSIFNYAIEHEYDELEAAILEEYYNE